MHVVYYLTDSGILNGEPLHRSTVRVRSGKSRVLWPSIYIIPKEGKVC
jgi:hypothetical protein